MDVHHALVDLVWPPSDGLEQLLAGQNGSRITRQGGDQACLAGVNRPDVSDAPLAAVPPDSE